MEPDGMSGAFTIDTSDLSAAAHELRDFGREAGAVLEVTTDAEGELVADAVRARARRHTASGRMARQVSAKSSGRGAHRRVTVHAAGRVAHLITGGTRAHPIRPLRADALRMAGVGRGFAEAVRHPGTRADPFVDRGLDDSRPELARLDGLAADKINRELANDVGG